mgnify:FL=1
MDAVDRVIITTLIDNYVDVFIPGTKNVERWGPPELVQGATVSYATTPPLIAEHGLSLLIETFREDQKQTYLFDAGFTKYGVPHNIEKLGVDLNKISSIVISHGHPDHTGALAEILKTAEKKIPVITHPSAFLKRYLVFPDGTRVLSNTFTEKALDDAGAEVLLSGDLAILGPGVVATGEIDMVNDFEQHFPLAYYEQNGEMEKDFFPDEKSLMINLKDKGLIVLSGCGHRGIINTVEYAKRATGIEQVHAVIGGFHLTGTTPMEKIERTVEEMKRIEPDFIIPTHCTGWKAMNRFADEMSDNFLLNAVGTRFILA